MKTANQQNLDDVAPEMAVRCSCDICMEAYDSKVHIPRVVKCGHSACQRCIRKLLDANANYKCPFCNSISRVPKVEELPINRSLIDIVDYVRSEGQKRSEEGVQPKYACANKSCVGEPKDLKEIAVCITKSCEQFRKYICLSCAVEGHQKHDVVRLEKVVKEVRNRSRARLQTMKDDATRSMREVYTLIERANGMKEEMWQNFKSNASLDDLIDRSELLCSQQDANELEKQGNDLIKPYTDAFASLKKSLAKITEQMEELLSEGELKEIDQNANKKTIPKQEEAAKEANQSKNPLPKNSMYPTLS